MLRVYPENEQTLRVAAVVACVRHDRAAAAQRFDWMAGRYTDDIWRGRFIFDRYLAWSRTNDVTTPRPPFLGAFFGLQQLAFVGDDHQLLVLGADPMAQLHTWDLDGEKQQRVLPLPSPALSPLFSSVSGKRVVCAVNGGPPQLVLVDLERRKAQPWPGLTMRDKATITADEKQYMTWNEARIAVYDLENPGPKSSKEISLKIPPVSASIPSEQKSWCVAVCHSDGRVRLLSEEGEDLIKPITLPHVAQRMPAIPGTPRLAVAGDGMLGIVDLEKAEFKPLVDGPTNDQMSFKYGMIVVTGDGKLAAVGCSAVNPQATDTPHTVEVWDLAEGKRLHTFPGHETKVKSLAFSTDKQRLASADETGFVQRWDLSPSDK